MNFFVFASSNEYTKWITHLARFQINIVNYEIMFEPSSSSLNEQTSYAMKFNPGNFKSVNLHMSMAANLQTRCRQKLASTLVYSYLHLDIFAQWRFQYINNITGLWSKCDCWITKKKNVLFKLNNFTLKYKLSIA